MNFYGQPVIDPGDYDQAHVVNPMGAGLPPVCSCGWTRWEYAPGKWFEIADHLRDMGEYVDGMPRYVLGWYADLHGDRIYGWHERG